MVIRCDNGLLYRMEMLINSLSTLTKSCVSLYVGQLLAYCAYQLMFGGSRCFMQTDESFVDHI